MAFAVTIAARLLLFPTPQAGAVTARQASLHAPDRSVAPPTGLSTLGFDPARYQTEPPACYRPTLGAHRIRRQAITRSGFEDHDPSVACHEATLRGSRRRATRH